MRSLIRWSACGLAGLTLAGCATGAYLDTAKKIRGDNPHASVEYLNMVLKEDPANKEAIALMDEVGKKIAADTNTKCEGFERSKKYAEAVAACDKLIATQDLINKGPSKVQIFYDRASRPRFAKLAAGDYYTKGKRYMTQKSFRRAGNMFARAVGFVPAYKDAQKLFEKMVSMGTTKVGVVPFLPKGYANKNLAQRFRQDLHDKIAELNPRYLKLAMGRQPESTALMKGEVHGTFGDSGWKQKRGAGKWVGSQRISAGTDAQGNPVYKTRTYTVRASWVVYSRTTKATLKLNYRIEGADGSSMATGNKTIKKVQTVRYVANFGGMRGHKDYWNAVPSDIKALPREKTEPAKFDGLTEAMANEWGNKGQPVYEFSHKVYTKFSK